MTCRLALAACLWLLPGFAMAASFDCTRARSKLNRVICSNAGLSRLDEQVWNTYGERVRGLSATQLADVRARHLRWRRERGLYETTVEGLAHDYRSHLDWLNHALFAREGRYRRGGPDGSGASLDIEADLRDPGAAGLRGLLRVPTPVAWRATARAAPDAGAPVLRLVPLRPDADAPMAADCAFTLRFEGDAVQLDAQGLCGADFGGLYEREGGR